MRAVNDPEKSDRSRRVTTRSRPMSSFMSGGRAANKTFLPRTTSRLIPEKSLTQFARCRTAIKRQRPRPQRLYVAPSRSCIRSDPRPHSTTRLIRAAPARRSAPVPTVVRRPHGRPASRAAALRSGSRRADGASCGPWTLAPGQWLLSSEPRAEPGPWVYGKVVRPYRPVQDAVA